MWGNVGFGFGDDGRCCLLFRDEVLIDELVVLVFGFEEFLALCKGVALVGVRTLSRRIIQEHFLLLNLIHWLLLHLHIAIRRRLLPIHRYWRLAEICSVIRIDLVDEGVRSRGYFSVLFPLNWNAHSILKQLFHCVRFSCHVFFCFLSSHFGWIEVVYVSVGGVALGFKFEALNLNLLVLNSEYLAPLLFHKECVLSLLKFLFQQVNHDIRCFFGIWIYLLLLNGRLLRQNLWNLCLGNKFGPLWNLSHIRLSSRHILLNVSLRDTVFKVVLLFLLGSHLVNFDILILLLGAFLGARSYYGWGVLCFEWVKCPQIVYFGPWVLVRSIEVLLRLDLVTEQPERHLAFEILLLRGSDRILV